MSGNPYIKENDELRAEIARLQESINYRQIADNHHQELMAEKEEEIEKLRADRETEHAAWVDIVSELRAALEEINQPFDQTENGMRTAHLLREIARRALAKEGKWVSP